MKKIFLLLLTAATTAISAQTENDIIGRWEYESVASYKGDADERELMESLLDGFSVQFDKDYIGAVTILERPIFGKWKYDSAKKTIELSTNDGKTKSFEVLKATPDALVVKQNNEFTLNLVRVTPQTLQPPKTPVTKSISTEQMVGNWDLTELNFSGKTVPASQIGGGFMNFKANGDFSSQILGISEQGKWQNVENNGVFQLQTKVKTKTALFYLIDRTQDKLVLAIPDKDGTLTFTKTK